MVHKFKKYSKKIMCMLSAGMFFVMAVFYPLELFRANPDLSYINSGTYVYTSSGTYNSFDYNTANTNLPIIKTSAMYEQTGFTETIDTYQFTRVFGSQHLFNSTSDTYAVRIRIRPAKTTVSGNQMYSYGYMFGGQDCFSNLSGTLIYYNGFQNFDHWYVTDFQSQSIMFSVFGNFFSNSHISAEGTYTDYASFSYDLQFYIDYWLFSIEDLNDELYHTLQSLYSNNQQMLSKLDQIYNSLDTVETKLQQFIDIANKLDTNTDELEGLLKTCNSYLSSIQSELEEQTSWLQKIYNAIIEYFGMQGDDSVEEMPDQEMDNMLNIESELLGDASASDLQNDLNVSIDADSGSFVWNLIDRLITSNSVVFGGFISVLSLGIVALILGR